MLLLRNQENIYQRTFIHSLASPLLMRPIGACRCIPRCRSLWVLVRATRTSTTTEVPRDATPRPWLDHTCPRFHALQIVCTRRVCENVQEGDSLFLETHFFSSCSFLEWSFNSSFNLVLMIYELLISRQSIQMKDAYHFIVAKCSNICLKVCSPFLYDRNERFWKGEPA